MILFDTYCFGSIFADKTELNQKYQNIFGSDRSTTEIQRLVKFLDQAHTMI